jgi:hypothetical protein
MLSEGNTGMYMPVAPAYAGGNGFGNGFGGDWAWIILLLLLGWGNNGWGNGGFGGMWGMDGIYPWMNQANLTSNGFQNQMLNDNVTSIRDGIHSLSTQLCNTGSDIQMALANGFSGVEQGANTRQMADMQQMFSLQSALQNCCCENRLATANLNSTIISENCADRQTINEGVQAILTNQSTNTQKILDQMCNDKIDAKNEKILELQNALNMATLRESQTAQNAFIQQGFSNEVDQLYNRLSNCPVPSTPVYGRTPIFTCNNGGCGCGVA